METIHHYNTGGEIEIWINYKWAVIKQGHTQKDKTPSVEHT